MAGRPRAALLPAPLDAERLSGPVMIDLSGWTLEDKRLMKCRQGEDGPVSIPD
jgi:hypothetical protein